VAEYSKPGTPILPVSNKLVAQRVFAFATEDFQGFALAGTLLFSFLLLMKGVWADWILECWPGGMVLIFTNTRK